MGCFKKNILLTNDKKQMMMLCIDKTPAGYFANFKNYSSLPDSCVLILSTNNEKFYKQNVYCNKTKGYDFKLPNDFLLDGKVACVLLDKMEEANIIATGVNGDNTIYKSKILEYIESYNKKNVVSKNINFEIKERDFLEENIDNGNERGKSVDKESELLNEDNVQEEEKIDLEDKEETTVIFGVRDSEDDAKVDLFEADEGEVEDVIDKEFFGEEGNFFKMVKEQIDELFRIFPAETDLEKMVPNSKWVRVDYEEGSSTYVLGLIYEMETLKYIAYGVPSKFGQDMTGILNGYSQWVPKDYDNVEGDGYYVMFQDAETGKNVSIEEV